MKNHLCLSHPLPGLPRGLLEARAEAWAEARGQAPGLSQRPGRRRPLSRTGARALGAGLALGIGLGSIAVADAAVCSVPSATYPTIQKAANTSACTQIQLAAGVYTEQVTLAKPASVTLVGAGAGRTIIRSPATRVRSSQPTTYLPSYTYVIEVARGGFARITDLTIDGGGNASCSERYFGVRFNSAQGSLERVIVDNVRGSGANFACPNIYAVAVTADSSGNGQLAVRASTVRNFQSVGVLVSGTDATAMVENTTIRGAGAQSMQAQTGVLFNRAGGGIASRNNVSALHYSGDPCKGLGTALSSDGAAAVSYSANVAYDVDRGMFLTRNTTDQAAINNHFLNTLVGIVSSANNPGRINLSGNGIVDTARSTAATVATCFDESGDGIAIRGEQKSVVQNNSIAGSARSAVELLTGTVSLDVMQNQSTGSKRFDLEDRGVGNHLERNRCQTSSPTGLCAAAP